MENPSLSFISQALLCPLSQSPLAVEGSNIKSPEGDIIFPMTNNIPWLYRHPFSQLAQWHNKIQSVAHYYDEQSKKAEEDLLKVNLLKSTYKRLSDLKLAYANNAKHFFQIANELKASSAQSELFFEKIPRQQTVMAYHQTLFRDWAWGQSEVLEHFKLIKPYLKGVKKMMALGAGACGLPLLIHNELNIESTLVVDINPLLLSTVKKMISGEKVYFTEFPTLPTGPSFIDHTLGGASIKSGFHFALADAQDLSVQNNFFDAILTPWFIDIVPRDFRELAKHFNSYLAMEGAWVNIGPLAFEKNQLTQIYSKEEVEEILIESGFKVLESKLNEIPYLQSPHSGINRKDKVLVFHAVKEKTINRPKRYEYLPEWLTHSQKPIPVTSELNAFKLKSILYAQVIQCINGKNSLDDIANLYAQQYNVSMNEARESLFVFLTNVYENVIYREF